MIYDQFTLAIFGGIGPMELVVIGLVGVLIFGNRLPDVGRSLGKGIVEFKKGIKGVDTEIEKAVDKDSNSTKNA